MLFKGSNKIGRLIEKTSQQPASITIYPAYQYRETPVQFTMLAGPTGITAAQ